MSQRGSERERGEIFGTAVQARKLNNGAAISAEHDPVTSQLHTDSMCAEECSRDVLAQHRPNGLQLGHVLFTQMIFEPKQLCQGQSTTKACPSLQKCETFSNMHLLQVRSFTLRKLPLVHFEEGLAPSRIVHFDALRSLSVCVATMA